MMWEANIRNFKFLKMKKLIILAIAFSIISCKKEIEKNKQTPTTNSTKKLVEGNSDTNSDASSPKSKADKSQINHFFSANGGSILYMKDGTIKSCARCDFEGDFLEGMLGVETAKDDTYRDYQRIL